MSEIAAKNYSSLLESQVNVFTKKSIANGMKLKERKCKELRISFCTSNKVFDPIVINNKNVEVVAVVKLVSVTLSDNLKWNSHIANMCKKSILTIIFPQTIKARWVTTRKFYSVYVTCIGPVIENACEAFSDYSQSCTTKKTWNHLTFCLFMTGGRN